MNIILVEDNDNVATLTELYLEKVGLAGSVTRTHRLKPFEALINTQKFDLAIIDYHLQFFDAPEFIQLTKESKRNSCTPIIVVSHEIDPKEEQQLNRMGVHYIRRHDDYMVFMELIAQTLRKMN